MYKKSILPLILALGIITLAGCNGEMEYSNKFDGIPIYPDTELVSDSDYKEYYEASEFDGTLEEVEKFYKDNIKQEQWDIEKNSTNSNSESQGLKSQSYNLKSDEQEIFLLIQLQSTKNKGDILYINLNGSPFEENEYNVEGESQHWKASLNYDVAKDKISIDGDMLYIGNGTPEKINNEFILYDTEPTSYSDEVGNRNIITTTKDQELRDGKVNIKDSIDREYELKVYEESINYGYIEIKWEEDGKEKSEKLSLEINQ